MTGPEVDTSPDALLQPSPERDDLSTVLADKEQVERADEEIILSPRMLPPPKVPLAPPRVQATDTAAATDGAASPSPQQQDPDTEAPGAPITFDADDEVIDGTIPATNDFTPDPGDDVPPVANEDAVPVDTAVQAEVAVPDAPFAFDADDELIDGAVPAKDDVTPASGDDVPPVANADAAPHIVAATGNADAVPHIVQPRTTRRRMLQ